MAAFHTLFRADIVSASFDDVIVTQASNGRTDAVRAAIAAQWGFDAPAKKDAFIAHATKALTVALTGDKLGVTGYKQRASLCAALSLTVAALKGETLSAEAELTRFVTAFGPVKKVVAASPVAASPVAAPTAAPTTTTDAAPTAAPTTTTDAASPTLQQALDMVLAAIASGLLTEAQSSALTDALSVTPALM